MIKVARMIDSIRTKSIFRTANIQRTRSLAGRRILAAFGLSLARRCTVAAATEPVLVSKKALLTAACLCRNPKRADKTRASLKTSVKRSTYEGPNPQLQELTSSQLLLTKHKIHSTLASHLPYLLQQPTLQGFESEQVPSF